MSRCGDLLEDGDRGGRSCFQLGKLRSFVADSGPDLGERLDRGPIELAAFPVIPRCSQLIWCVVVQRCGLAWAAPGRRLIGCRRAANPEGSWEG